MNWLILTLLAICSRAFYSIGTKVLTSTIKVSAMTQAVLLTGAATILTILISPLVGGLSFAHVSDYWPLLILMVLAQAVGNVLFFIGQPKLEASVTQVAFSSILLWSVILSLLFLGSHFSPKQAVGIVILFAAILLVQYRKGAKRIEPAALFIIASAALFAAFQVASARLANHVATGTYLLLAYGGSAAFIGAIYNKKVSHEIGSVLRNRSRAFLALLFASGTSLLYFAFSYFAYQQAPDRGIVVVLLTSQVVLSVILGIIILKERSGMDRKLTAGALAVVAGVLIKS